MAIGTQPYWSFSPLTQLERDAYHRHRTPALKNSSDMGGWKPQAMSTIEEVRSAEKKVQELVDALRQAGAQDPNDLTTQLKNASDEYARAVRELDSRANCCA